MTIMVKEGIGSGTDMNTLLEEGTDNNHFLSLIVNNAGKYAAAITRHIVEKGNGTLTPTYKTFNDISIEGEVEDFDYEDEYIEYWVLDIEIEKVELEETELEKRFKELKKSATSYVNKKSLSTTVPSASIKQFSPTDIHMSTNDVKSLFADFNKDNNSSNKPFGYYNYFDSCKELKDNKKEPKQLELWDDIEDIIPYGEDHVDPKLIDESVKQIVTGNIFAALNSKLDLDVWSKNMEKAYNTRFGENFESFKYFADSFIDAISSECETDPQAENGPDYAVALWAYDVSERLKDFPSNKYIEYYIKVIERSLL